MMPNIYGSVGRGCFEKIKTFFDREREGEITSGAAEAGIKEALLADGWKESPAESFAWWIVTVASNLSHEKPDPKDYYMNGMYFKRDPVPAPSPRYRSGW